MVFFNIHHIIADRRSLTILRDELNALYQAAVRRNRPHSSRSSHPICRLRILGGKASGRWANAEASPVLERKLAGVPEYLDLHRRPRLS